MNMFVAEFNSAELRKVLSAFDREVSSVVTTMVKENCPHQLEQVGEPITFFLLRGHEACPCSAAPCATLQDVQHVDNWKRTVRTVARRCVLLKETTGTLSVEQYLASQGESFASTAL